MMAQLVPHQSTEKRRVKVYELRNNDWFDRGTGFCCAMVSIAEDGSPKDPRVQVESEDQPDRLLLETHISKEDGFQKQQDTLIVWTEPSSQVDMALSFQEPDGCAMIWKFVSSIQQSFHGNMGGADDSLSDDLAMEMSNPINLPAASLENLADIEATMRAMSTTASGRDALAKFIMSEDYISKLIPLVDVAEENHSLADLHRLCNIVKMILLLNDTSIIEHAVSDECVLGVVGALEYDPEFPTHKANHRSWLDNQGRYKEVVPISDEQILRKIHQTYRLQYLKDVVLARILDDPTFSVLNSLIFFNQVDIVQGLQANAPFLSELFGIFTFDGVDEKRKKEAVLFIQQCCAIAKNLQPPARQNLYNNFITHGLLQVINFGLRHSDVAVRVGATDILVSMIDHDPQLIRQTLYRQLQEKQQPLTDSLVDLLLVEVDLGVKSQVSDALKVLLDQGPPLQPAEAFAKTNGEFPGRARPPQATPDPQQDILLAYFYDHSANRLFKPLRDLEHRKDMKFDVQEASMFSYLIEILSFFIRQHHHRSKFFVLQHNIHVRVAQLLACPEKYLKLVAIRFFRHLVGLQDEFYVKQVIEKRLLGPILDVLIDTLPRDNLLSSACLELFNFVRHAEIKDLKKYLVETYRDRLMSLAYMELFRDMVLKYDQTRGFTSADATLFEPDEDVTGRRTNTQGRRLIEPVADAVEDDSEYFNTSDDEEDQATKSHGSGAQANGVTTPGKLVDYDSDEQGDDEAAQSKENVEAGGTAKPSASKGTDAAAGSNRQTGAAAAPPERISEKRRREEDEEEDLGKTITSKRRNSTSASSNPSPTSGFLRKRKSLSNTKDSSGSAPKKIAITISSGGKRASSQAGGSSQDDVT